MLGRDQSNFIQIYGNFFEGFPEKNGALFGVDGVI